MSVNIKLKLGSGMTKVLIIIFLCFLLFFTLGLLATNYEATLIFLAGIICFNIFLFIIRNAFKVKSNKFRTKIHNLIRRIINFIRKYNLKQMGLISIVFFVVLTFLFSFITVRLLTFGGLVPSFNQSANQILAPYEYYGQNPVCLSSKITEYKSRMKPVDESLFSFNLTEESKFKCIPYPENDLRDPEIYRSLKEKLAQQLYVDSENINIDGNENSSLFLIISKKRQSTIDSNKSLGFANRTITFTPLPQIDSSWSLESPGTIMVENLPAGAFDFVEGQSDEDIKYKRSMKKIPSIEWTIEDIIEPISFQYFKPPYYYASFILRFFTRFSTLWHGIVIAFGMVVAFLGNQLFLPVITSIIQDDFKVKIDKIKQIYISSKTMGNSSKKQILAGKYASLNDSHEKNKSYPLNEDRKVDYEKVKKEINRRKNETFGYKWSDLDLDPKVKDKLKAQEEIIQRNQSELFKLKHDLESKISHLEKELKQEQQKNKAKPRFLSLLQIMTNLIVILLGVVLLVNLGNSGMTEKPQSQITFDIGTALIGVAAVSATVIYGVSQQGRNSERDSDGE